MKNSEVSNPYKFQIKTQKFPIHTIKVKNSVNYKPKFPIYTIKVKNAVNYKPE